MTLANVATNLYISLAIVSSCLLVCELCRFDLLHANAHSSAAQKLTRIHSISTGNILDSVDRRWGEETQEGGRAPVTVGADAASNSWTKKECQNHTGRFALYIYRVFLVVVPGG